MGRIRTIKPEFPQSESIGRLSREARLLFLMLFTIADDEGRARASSRMLASLLYPYDDDAKSRIAEWLGELERENCVELYEADGNAYLSIVSWLAHQRIDKPSRSRLPPAPAGGGAHSPNPREVSPPEGNGVEGKGSDASDVPSDPCDFTDSPSGLRIASAATPTSPTSALTRARGREVTTKTHEQYPEDFQAFWREYPTDALMSKKRAFEQWRKLVPGQREATRRAIPGFKDYCRKHPTYRPVHAERFLSEQRFEGFAREPVLSAEEIEANKDRADRLMRRGKYAVNIP
ncbi:MAG TPA: hypothetical protein VGP01_06885 [Rhizomicrobium sp.]|jgi:hypothetical protein|nr:hypothetical protein [Rhizomicrobium sp.]